MSKEESFSQRYGFEKVEDVLQINSMDDNLRVALFSVFYECCIKKYVDGRGFVFDFVKSSCSSFLHMPMNEFDEMNPWPRTMIEELTDIYSHWFKKCLWYEIYNLLEDCIGHFRDYPKNKPSHFHQKDFNNFCDEINKVLQRENSGHRLIDGKFARIIDEIEIDSINETSKNDDKSIKMHISDAFESLFNRENPKYRNSIKESISTNEQ